MDQLTEEPGTVYRSEDYPAKERVNAWADMTIHSIMPTTIRVEDPGGFTASMRQAEFGSTAFSALTYSPLQCVRTAAHIRRSDPESYMLALTLRGAQSISQMGRDATLGPDDLVLYDSSSPHRAVVTAEGGPAESLLVHIPRTLVSLPREKVSKLLALRLPARQGIAAVVARTVTTLSTEAGRCTPGDAVRLGAVVLDLFNALLAHHLEADGSLPTESRRNALVLRIQDFVQRNLPDPGLTPDRIAAAHHISTSYLHRLFQRQDTTVAAFVRRQRLDRCRRDLADPALAHVPIHAVAAGWGFPEPAVFSRAFRAAFDLSPRDYRNTAVRALRPVAARDITGLDRPMDYGPSGFTAGSAFRPSA